MYQAYLINFFLLLTFISAVYAFLSETEISSYLLLAIIFSGIIFSVFVNGGIPLYPQWHFYSEPIDQNVTYTQLLIGDSSGRTILYDHRASSSGGSGREHRPSPLLLGLNEEKQSLLACKLIQDAREYRNMIENENYDRLATPQGFGITWNKSALNGFDRFTFLQIQEKSIYLSQDGKQVINRTQSVREVIKCS